jgi:site-specific recombinase XerD
MHVGRHTFASEFLRRGGQLHVLKDLMGHSDIKTTMVYVHLDTTHARSQMNLMDDQVGPGA